jgi:hypothetical protein
MTLFNHKNYIPDQLKFLTTTEAIDAFKKGYTKFMGTEPKRETLALLVAQSALETGWWKAGLHCWNFGNTRCQPDKLEDEEYFTMFKCSEIIKGKEIFYYPPDPASVFQGFKTCEDGIRHHIKFLTFKDRYRAAWHQIIVGDPEQYVVELFKAGYFTANLELYKKTVISIYGKIISQIDTNKETLTEKDKEEFLKAVSVSVFRNLSK